MLQVITSKVVSSIENGSKYRQAENSALEGGRSLAMIRSPR
jgi:hypothetical protein